MMIKTEKNKQTHKQTNKKQTNKHFNNPNYLSKIKSDIHEFFWVAFCGCPKTIKAKTNKSIKKQINIFRS